MKNYREQTSGFHEVGVGKCVHYKGTGEQLGVMEIFSISVLVVIM